MVPFIKFLAIVLTALALVPSGAHVLALNNKINLPDEQYLIVQAIYRGWDALDIIWIAAIFTNLLLAVMLRRERAAFVFAMCSVALFALAFAVLFGFTIPANQATQNWTAIPRDDSELRMVWEYSHVVNAILLFLALCSTTLTALLPRR